MILIFGGAAQAGMGGSYENSGKVLQNVTNASQRPLVFMLRGAAPGGMGNSHENPLLGGERVGPSVRNNPPRHPSNGRECHFHAQWRRSGGMGNSYENN